jgi:hypothetical protein
MNNSRILFLVLFLLLFGGYYAASSFFYHTHLIGGQQIVHSHPFSDHDEGHSHSRDELVFYMIHALNMVWLLSGLFFLIIYRERIHQTSSFLNQPAIQAYNISTLPQRGPPFLN